VALVSIITSLAGYALARFKFRGRDFLFFLLVVLTFFPIGGSFLAQYELMHQLHLRNSFLGLILLYSAGFGIPLFFMRQVFLHIPSELEEAARIDGASDFRIFSQIMLPLATGGLVLAVVMIFIRVWGDNWLCYLMIDSAEKMTLGAGMWNLAPITPAAAGVSREAVVSTFLTFFMLPSILLFAGLQRWFIRGAMEGLKL
jgi:multiple sugar transport system permease protein